MSLSWSFGAKVPADTRSGSRGGELVSGQAFGPFKILGLLGEGSTSRVYRARGESGEVALKLPKESALDDVQRERFRREGELAARLDHPGVVRVHSGGEVDGIPFLAYELVEGVTDLRSRIGQVGLRERVRLVMEAAAAVAFAHGQGVVHRDLKPANLLVDTSGRVRVADLGLALAQGQARLTRDDEVVGTPRYMAPEQTETMADTGPPADVWALGVILYEALSGRRPFPAKRWLELRRQIRETRPESLRAAHPSLPIELEQVCFKALATSPRDRYPNAGGMAQDLATILQRLRLPDDPAGAPSLSTSRSGTGSSRLPFPLGRLGEFDLLDVLGRGGMGIVYRARDLELDRDVALKFILNAHGNSKRIERFRREGEVTASLNHPSILKVHGAGVLDGTPYLKYELVEDSRTFDVACEGLELRQRLELLRDAARGLGHAHTQGVVHRDVKPDNILVAGDGRVLVADFGLAAAQGFERMTRTGALVGTPHYMAPEQVGGERDLLGAHTDVWALGVMLFETLVGQLPFQGEHLVELSVDITTTPTPSPRQPGSGADRGLEAMCFKALAKEPHARYPNADAFADDLDAWLEGRPLTASTVTALIPLVKRSGKWTLILAPLVISLIAFGGILAQKTRASKVAPETVVGDEASSTPPDGPWHSEEWLADGRASWRDIKALNDPGRQVAEAHTWLGAYADHPLREKVEALVSERRFTYPVMTLRHTRRQGGETRTAFIGDDRLLVAGADGQVSLWDLKTGHERRRWTIAKKTDRFLGLRGILFTGAGSFFVGTPRDLVQIDMTAGERRRFPEVRAIQMARSPDGREVAVGSDPPTLPVFDLASGEFETPFGGFRATVLAVAYTPDGERLIALSGGKNEIGLPTRCSFSVWNVRTRELVAEAQDRGLGRCLAVAPSGDLFVVGTNSGKLLAYDAHTGAELWTLISPDQRQGSGLLLNARAHDGSIKGVTFSHDGSLLYSVSAGTPDWKNQLRVWNVESRQEHRPKVSRDYGYEWIELSPNGKLLAIGTGNGTVELWSAE